MITNMLKDSSRANRRWKKVIRIDISLIEEDTLQELRDIGEILDFT